MHPPAAVSVGIKLPLDTPNEVVVRFLFVGDIVGSPGIAAVKKIVPHLRKAEGLSFVVANAENTTNGSGLSPKDYRQLRAAGVDAITLGDHIYKKLEIAEVMRVAGEPICRPANFPDAAPGRDHVRFRVGETEVAVVSLLGRTYMRPVDCPFAAADRVLAGLGGAVKVVVVDVHAEATADKYLMFHHLKGRVSAVLGSHTHVPTADEQVTAGTAFQCDVGMTGPYDSILGRRVDRVLTTAVTFIPTAFDVATDDVRLAGTIVDVDPATGAATAVKRVMVREADIG
jgi:metallophosphoesterase (TIGR00282 family)